MNLPYNFTPYIFETESRRCLENVELEDYRGNVTTSHTFNYTYGNTTKEKYHYTYRTCNPDMIVKYEYKIHKDMANTTCICIKDFFNDCLPMMQNAKCENIFLSVAILQLLATIVGILLNGTVLRVFLTRKAIQKRVPNILLYIQAITDMIGCLVYGLPVSLLLFFEIFYRHSHALDILAVTVLCLSSSSSVMIYTLIASERCLATIKPLWHRANVRVGHIWKGTWVIWLLSLAGSVLTILFFEVFKMEEMVLSMYVCLGVMVILVTFTLSLTFYKALQAVRHAGKIRRTGSMRQNQNNINNRKQLRLGVILLIMYIFFLLGFIPVLSLDPVKGDYHPTAKIMYLLFQLTSILNPSLTLTLKDDFKIKWKKVNKQTSGRSTDVSMKIKISSPSTSQEHIDTVA